ncbi:response regulator [Pelobacter propionicus]|uniref:Response regulator receiver protein n=1 Tax=Pelobacter propionicus (strain DSM 2379 / NBRC 103807 / OttBd1) TaxID=338966 RepID=A0R7L2_PELPD|nr:response regulator [Pelobacter propionicus]ABL01222.1 response regulator receiver protein [Pelobacter propionicus DSM 2379]
MILKPITVLIVEDEPGHAKLALKYFSKLEDVTSLTFSTGRKALEYLADKEVVELRHHVVVLDLNMPGMDGQQVLENIKKSEKLAIVPVIVLSSTDSEEEISKCYASGANLYLVKQMDYAEYKNTLFYISEYIQMYRRT